jgi:site-specific DNA-cytosine methylase
MNRENETNKIAVLALFDGISVGRAALKSLGIPVKYFASEIDKKAMEASANNHNDVIQLGDVRHLDTSQLPPIQLLIAGSPCQDLSSLKMSRLGLDGEKSGLFFDALRILHEVKPEYFLFENVASMAKSERNRISELLGTLTGQMRKRLYWTNIEGVTQPKKKGIKLADIIEHGHVDREKSLVVLTRNIPQTLGGLKRYLYKGIGQVVYSDETFVIRGSKESTRELCLDAPAFTTVDGFEYKYGFRKMTIKELCRLQGLDDNYMDGIAYTTAHTCLGNAFTKPVIEHILSFVKF